MSITPDVARQYLKAMGIESWESRRSAVAPIPIPEASTASWQGAVLYNRDSFAVHLAQAQVIETPPSHARVLVVLEGPALTVESQDLLASMFKAINIDLSSQAIVNLHSSGADTVESVATTVRPEMILCMARFQSNLSELASLRDDIHRAAWTTAPIALTLHPALLLVQPELKRPAWEDLKRVKAALDG